VLEKQKLRFCQKCGDVIYGPGVENCGYSLCECGHQIKIKKQTIEKYSLKAEGLPNSWWADIAIGQDGFVSIQSDYGDYNYFWNSFGKNIKEFLIGCDVSYLYGKFGPNLEREFDLKASIKELRKYILESRRTLAFDAKDCRVFWDATKDLERMSITSSDRWYEELCESDLDRLYEGDISYAPCVTSNNFHLTFFLKEIWPHFIACLKEELKISRG